MLCVLEICNVYENGAGRYLKFVRADVACGACGWREGVVVYCDESKCDF